MVKIKPFEGIRYSSKLRGEIKTLLSPPFDVFDYGDGTDRALKSFPYNFSHIIKPDGEGDAKYKNARIHLLDLLKKKVLIKEKKDALYFYEQVYNNLAVAGLIAAVKLEDYENGLILPHELTRNGPVEDRTKLLDSLQINTGLIYTLFRGTLPEIEGKLLFDFVDSAGITNRLWAITDQDIIENIKSEMTDKKIYIADGHHRYRTALEYAKKFDRRLEKDISTNYFLSFIVPDNQVLILPYNRIIYNMNDQDYDNLIERVIKDFDVLEPQQPELKTPDQARIIYMYYKQKVYKLIPKGVFKEDYKLLDVNILHDKILQPLGYDKEKLRSGEGIIYVHGTTPVQSIPSIVESMKNAVGFSLRPVSVEEVEAIAEGLFKQHEITMPPKWTFFYPKPFAGLVSYGFSQ